MVFEAAGMAVISNFECIFRESYISFYFVVIQRGDRCLVNDPGCEAFPFHWPLGVFFYSCTLCV